MALTKVAAVNPPVRASTPTPSGMATWIAVSPEGSPWSRLWRSSHSLTKPHSGGRAQMARPATMNTGALSGSRLTRPPSRSRSRNPVACWSELAERNSEPLKTAWNTTMQEGGHEGDNGERAVPGGGEEARGPDPEQHQTDVVGRGIRQQAFEVGARRRVQGAEERGQPAECHDEEPPPRRPAAEQRCRRPG